MMDAVFNSPNPNRLEEGRMMSATPLSRSKSNIEKPQSTSKTPPSSVRNRKAEHIEIPSPSGKSLQQSFSGLTVASSSSEDALANPTDLHVDQKHETLSYPNGAPSPPTLRQKMRAEAIGTALLVHFGCGSVCCAIYTSALVGLGQATTIWTLGAALALYTTASISGGHLNPAVTLAFALVRRRDFPFKNVPAYWLAQFSGAMIAGIVNYYVFGPAIREYEETNDIVRGTDSIDSARGFGVYWTNLPGPGEAFLCEMWGTAMLTFVIFAITSKTNNVPDSAVPAIVGVAIGCIIAIIGPLSGGGINPARDLGPRFVSFIAGWESDAYHGMLVYLIAPLIGGPIGAVIADGFLRDEKKVN
eukprot:CAMPEP_0195509570 /NCGR_PEP_ID=MMETSP0794_2-20130614/2472_1 /TAXON_ID=515487 /ORGANISM="Stephanopyxis turris, Strain CCMP 815" /LENGTH=358 /DNA_ID=CAMNT_0040636825 /DNA_START=692 /DNA_END=1768 /DNA_ORIENTATION=+